MYNILYLCGVLTALCSVILIDRSFGQVTDSIHSLSPTSFKTINTTGLSNFTGKERNQWIKIDDVTIETPNIGLTPIEKALARAESMEIKALLNRDTLALKSIWLRDFTLVELQNKVYHDPNPLPHYLSLHRRIENILMTDDHAYVSGTEYAVQIKEDGKVDTEVAQPYTHMWLKELFGWKLAAKTYEHP